MLTENAIKVLEKRYLTKDESGKVTESPSELFRRVSKAISMPELNYGATEEQRQTIEDKFFDLMNNCDFFPNTPTLINAGKKLGNLSGCFVLPVEDTMEGIFDSIKNAAIIHKEAGGTGFSFSRLRPAGSKVRSTSGIASGPVSFMKVFNAATEAVKQGGTRRGANMGILRVDHPDIEEFISCKDDLTQLTNFNISVSITDEFLEAYRKNKKYKIKDPRTGEPYKVDGKIVEKDAVEIMNKIAFNAWKTGEPGIIFIDVVNKNSTTNELIESSNPCLYKDTLMINRDNIVSICDDIVKTEFKCWKTGTKKCIRLNTNAGYEIILTPEHKIMLDNGDFIEARNSIGEKLKWGVGTRDITDVEDNQILRGFLFGDGFLCSNRQGIAVRINTQKENDVYRLLIKNGFHLQDSGDLYINKNKLSWLHVEFLEDRVYNRVLPWDIIHGYSNKTASFLKGVFEANGSISSRGQISLKGTCKKTINLIQILLSSFGIKSWVIENKSTSINWKNGVYVSKVSYNLQIAPRNSEVFKNKIGFYSSIKNSKFKKFDKEYNGKLIVTSIDDMGELEVWDFKTENLGYAFANGFVVHNCSEQFLPPYDSCNLGSINLSNFVTADKKIDYDRLDKVVSLSVNFLDNVIDANLFPLKEIEAQTLKNRRIGLGVMGFADMLVKLGIRYDSEMGFKTGRELMEFIDTHATNASIELAKQRGVFPSWKSSKYFPDIKIRNATVTTVAPTGSISIIAGCSSGIEPYYAICFERNIMEGTKLIETNKIFEEVAKTRNFYSKKLMQTIAQGNSIQNIDGIPDDVRETFRTAIDISPSDHIRMQSEFQKYCTNSISKTINMPSSATVDDVLDSYILAYDLGCRSISVYRDGSRENQVLSTGKTKFRGTRVRPDELNGITEKITTGNGNMYITINTDGNIPFEVFANVGKSGWSTAADTEAICRLISLCLRNGIDIDEVIEQLSDIGGDTPIHHKGKLIKSIPDAIAKALHKRFGKNDLQVAIPKCANCNGDMVLSGGCFMCKNCGKSKC